MVNLPTFYDFVLDKTGAAITTDYADSLYTVFVGQRSRIDLVLEARFAQPQTAGLTGIRFATECRYQHGSVTCDYCARLSTRDDTTTNPSQTEHTINFSASPTTVVVPAHIDDFVGGLRLGVKGVGAAGATTDRARVYLTITPLP